ncbi:hypothetical protein EYF80_012601 [Liparis tanakae]|uniref:Uncharacterized protein n=1 Tax=Liparis tanakae TaxID=230148 RepID=A0A4Z2IIN2_9TELE|nr:hypothetical protein EYF80_012601 [Liparis tanakae]
MEKVIYSEYIVTTLGPSPVGFPSKHQGFVKTKVRFRNMLYVFQEADHTTAPLLTLFFSTLNCSFHESSVGCWLMPTARATAEA